MAIVNQHPAFANLGKTQKTREIPVTDSSFISIFRYDPNGQQLTVVFKNGAEYVNQNVDQVTVDKLTEAADKSRFYLKNIKGQSPATRIVDKTVGPALRRDNGKSTGSRDAGSENDSKSTGSNPSS